MVDFVTETNAAGLILAAKFRKFANEVTFFGLNGAHFIGVLALDEPELQTAQLDNISGFDFIALLIN